MSLPLLLLAVLWSLPARAEDPATLLQQSIDEMEAARSLVLGTDFPALEQAREHIDRAIADARAAQVALKTPDSAPRPMSSQSFAAFLAGVERAPDEGRLALVRSAATKGGFTADQGREILTRMNQSSAQLEAALIIYPRLSDPENLPLMMEGFAMATDRQTFLQRIGK